jgi:hypothetical protein
MKTVFLILTFLLLNFYENSGQVLFHDYCETASSWDIIKWNTPDSLVHAFILRETVDNKGRVIQLEFLENGKYSGHLCYLANRVIFEYTDNKIIETLFSADKPLYATDCEMWYKKIYHLDSDDYITKVETFALYDTAGLNSAEIAQWKKWVPEYSVQDTNSGQFHVDYYDYSYSKMSGLYPISKNFKLTDDYYHEDQPERESIVKGIKNIKKNNR